LRQMKQKDAASAKDRESGKADKEVEAAKAAAGGDQSKGGK
jgi:hypothetical protein